MIKNIVPLQFRGKTAKNGRTPYEVLIFWNEEQYETIDYNLPLSETEKKTTKKFIVAKFGCYGDATRYAHQLNTSPNPPKIVLIRA